MHTSTILVLAVVAIALIAIFAMVLRGPERANAKSEIAMPILQEQKVETIENRALENELLVLRLLIWDGHAPKEHIAKFEKQIEDKYGRKVKLQFDYVSGADDFYEPIRNRKTDIVMMTHHYFRDEQFSYIQKKLLLPLDLKNIPNFKHVIPSLKRAKHLYEDGQVYAVPYSQGPYGLVYNTELLDAEPESWNIFWEPRFKGQYVIGANEYIYNVNVVALAMGYPVEDISNFEALNNKEFKTKLRQFTENAHSFWVGVDTPDDLSGRPLATSWSDSLGGLKKRGEIWKIAKPKEGMPCWIDNFAITWALADKPFLKKVAEEYINTLLTTDYQIQHIIRYASLSPITTNISDLVTPQESERLHIGVPNFFEKNLILQHTYSQRDRNGIKLLWEEAMEGITVGK